MDSFLAYLAPDVGDVFFLFWAKQILISAAILAVFYVLSKILRLLLSRLGRHYSSLAGSDLIERILQRISEPAALLMNCAGLYWVMKRLPLPERLNTIAAGVVFVVNVVIVANIAYRVLDELLNRYSNKLGADMSRQLIPLVQKLCSIFLIGTALIITLKHFNYDILSLVTALGVGSLAIGLAAKDTLANMISGFTLMIDRPFRIGDRIELRGQVGDVVDIGLRSTKIKATDNTFLIIPNSELCNSTLVNMDFSSVQVRGSVSLGIAYGSNMDEAKALLVKAAASVPEVLSDPAPAVYFTGFGDSAINLTLYFWTRNSRQLVPVTDSVVRATAAALQQNGVSLPYPTRTVFLEKEISYAPQD